AALGALVGLRGADVAFTSDGGSAFAVLMSAWGSGRRPRVGTVASEYGGNARVLARLAAERGWELVELPVDDAGRVRDLPDGLDLVTLPQVASQRGVAQPVQALLGAGVPVVLDVAQSLGQTPVPAGCAAYVATSRKWLCGPRGVGVLAVEPGFEAALVDPPTLAPTLHAGVRRFELQEPHVAGRVGLSVAVQEWTPALLPRVHALAAHARRVLGVAGWQVVELEDEPTGITTLVPPAAVDPAAVRAALLARGVVVSAVPASRAAELTGPVLRVSTAAWVREDELDRLAELLSTVRA
ncbi:MAG: aminotransferase class, partial [Frankiales bacterium]|nr:aminotransferase class [Frankiales bacterium]